MMTVNKETLELVGICDFILFVLRKPKVEWNWVVYYTCMSQYTWSGIPQQPFLGAASAMNVYLRVGTYAPVSEPVHVTPWLGGGYPREFQPGLLMRREKPISVRYLPWLIWMTHSFRLLTPMHREHKNDLGRDRGAFGFLWKLQESVSTY